MSGSVRKIAVDLFYDILSPYSYIAFEVLVRLNKKSDVMDLKLQPSLLGGILNATGNQTPITVAAKAKYMMLDLERMCRYYHIPYKYPATALPVMHQKGSLTAQRLLIAAKENNCEKLQHLSQELYRKLYFEDTNVDEPKNMLNACKNVGFSDSESENLLLLTKDSKIKQILKDQVQLALSYGAFGLPTCVAHLDFGPEMFFGCDRLPLLAHCLNIPFEDLLRSK